MEAEAQCAKLAELGLVDGIITDDSDVFLFGGTQCFKNIFNDNKYAECFLSTDIVRELSLSRERLISLAYLLGSDYTIGLPGVGPVVALELLANFPGERGIEEFKEWWGKVQKGQDGAETNTKWKTSFVSYTSRTCDRCPS
jgi:DNA excision repair protein ERCC-5